jgi:hypothetical protein
VLRSRRTRGGTACLLALPVVLTSLVVTLAPVAHAATAEQRTRQLFVVHDPDIDEDSALVHAGSRFVTTNDNGDKARVFLVGPNGHTVGMTYWAKRQSDCEAVAPIDSDHVWIGDIGDNFGDRSSITIAEVPVAKGTTTVHVRKYHLAYPTGPANAETLMRNPVTGRLYIATKNPAGGELYAVPRDLQTGVVNELRPLHAVLPTATDGSFFPGGNYLAIRNYKSAVVYTWPAMTPVGTFRLPVQQQGEGLAASGDGAVDLSSEGKFQPVLHLRLPARLRNTIEAGPSGLDTASARARDVAPVAGG